jgi:hypothetical protein
MIMKKLVLFLPLVLTSVSCYAEDTIPFPKFAKGSWSVSTSAVPAKGESFRTDDRVSACWDPVVTMREDIDKIRNNKCEVNVTSTTEHEVNFTISCPRDIFDVKRYVKLSFPDKYHFHQHESSSFAKTDLWGTYVGPCPSE